MSSSERTVRLTTDNPQAEILLVDSRFRVVTRGVSPLEKTIPVGIYAVKVKVGDEEKEELFSVRPDGAQQLSLYVKAPAFSTPVPLDNTATTHEYHQAAAQKYLGPDAPRITLGAGSSLMLCVRDPSRTNFSVTADQHPTYAQNFNGFRLLGAEGAVLVDFDKDAEHNVADGFMAARVDVAVGSYALAYESGGERLCIPLPTAANWTLQAYLQVLPLASGTIEMRPDFRDVALIFDRTSNGFDPQRSDLQAIETVRKGLVEGRNYVDTGNMHEMLSGKFENPILGLYGAHLLLLESPLDLDRFRIVIGNTARLLGDRYPDVIALAWAYQRHAGQSLAPVFADFKDALGQLTGPPLLARSWDLLVDAAREVNSSLLTSSPAFRVAGDLVAQGVYLTWRSAVQAPAVQAQPAPRHEAARLRPDRSVREVLMPARSARGLYKSILSGLGNIAFEVLKGLRGKPAASSAGPLPVENIEAIKSTEEAGAVLRWVARSYDWQKLLPEMKRNPEWIGKLSGLQRDLTLIMRNATLDEEALDGFTPAFVEKLLETHRVPLETLVRALSGLELGGYWSSALRKFIDESKANKNVASSAGS